MARYEYLNVTNLKVGQAQGKGTFTIGDKATTNTVGIGTGASSTTTLSIATGATSTGAVQIGGTGGTLTVGVFASTASGSGTKLSSSRTGTVKIYSDDGGVALTTGDYRATLSRMLVGTAITSGNITITALQGHLKFSANAETSSYMSAVRGYVEVIAGKTISNSSAFRASVEMPATAVIASGSIVSAFLVDSLDINCTHTGKASIFNIAAPAAGTWDYFLVLPAGTGVSADSGAGGGTSKYLKVLYGGAAYSILMKSDS